MQERDAPFVLCYLLHPVASGVSSWDKLVECISYACECSHKLLLRLYTMLLFASSLFPPCSRIILESFTWSILRMSTFRSMSIMCLENVNRLRSMLCVMCLENVLTTHLLRGILLRCYLLSQFSYGSGKLCCKFYRNWSMRETLTRILQNGHLSYSTVSDISILLVKSMALSYVSMVCSIHVLSRHHRKRQFN